MTPSVIASIVAAVSLTFSASSASPVPRSLAVDQTVTSDPGPAGAPYTVTGRPCRHGGLFGPTAGDPSEFTLVCLDPPMTIDVTITTDASGRFRPRGWFWWVAPTGASPGDAIAAGRYRKAPDRSAIRLTGLMPAGALP